MAKKKAAKKVVKKKKLGNLSKSLTKKRRRKNPLVIKAPIEPAIMDDQFDDMEDDSALDLGPSATTDEEPGLF